MAKQTNAKIGFENELWAAADAMRGNVSASDYRKIVVGLIFLKYVSDAFDFRYQELLNAEDYYEGDEEDRDAYIEKNVFFVPETARWSVISSSAHTPEIGVKLDEAMRAIEKENNSLKNVLPIIYASPDIDKRVLGNVVDIFTNIEMHSENEEQDLLGRAYEYFIEKFAALEGKNGGEFYSPSSIVKTIVAILKPFKGRVYDPACGSGGMFVQSAKFVREHSGNINDLSIYGQEANPDTWKMAKMNMALRGLEANFGADQADTFHNDLHPTLKADFVMANPPFNISDWGGERLTDDVRWKYGVPPTGNANYAWMQHMISHLAPKGKMGFRKGRENRDQIANIHLIIEKAREFQKNIYFCFIDYAKTFDCVDHNQLWKILKEMGIPDHLICLLRNLYAGQEATVRTGHGTTEGFQIGKGVHQGCILSPYLFNLYAEYIMRNAGLEETQTGIKIAGRNINNLRYADDTTLMAESRSELKSLLMKVKEEREKAGLKPNIQKTKIMASGPITSWDIDGETVEM